MIVMCDLCNGTGAGHPDDRYEDCPQCLGVGKVCTECEAVMARHRRYYSGIGEALKVCRVYRASGEPAQSDRAEIFALVARLAEAKCNLLDLGRQLDLWSGEPPDDWPLCETCGHWTHHPSIDGWCRLLEREAGPEDGCPSHVRKDGWGPSYKELEAQDAAAPRCDCGQMVQAAFEFCPGCGTQLRESEASGPWCPKCLGPIAEPVESPPARDSIMESLRAIAFFRKGFPSAVKALRTTTRGTFKFVCNKCQTVVVVNCPNCADLRARLVEVEGLVVELAEELDAWTHNPRYWGYEDVYTCSECQHYFQDVAGGPTWQNPLSILFDHAWCQLTGFARPPDWHCSAFVAREGR